MSIVGYWNLLMIVIIAFCSQRAFGWRGMWIFLGTILIGLFVMFGVFFLLGVLS